MTKADLAHAGLDGDSKRVQQIGALAREIVGFPRHLSQHVGGFVITRSRLDELVPIEQRRHGRAHLRRMGQGRSRRARHSEDRRARPRHADLPAQGARSGARALWRTADAGHHPGRRSRRLPHARPRRHDRRLPDRKSRADDDAAAPEAGELLRSRHRSCDRAPRPDPGRHGASIPAPPARAGAGVLPVEGIGGGAVQNPGRAAVPGAGDADRHRRRRLHARRRPTSCAAPWPPSSASAPSALSSAR